MSKDIIVTISNMTKDLAHGKHIQTTELKAKHTKELEKLMLKLHREGFKNDS